MDGKYDVTVIAQANSRNGEVRHVVNDISVWTKARPPVLEKEEIYIRAVEEATGCKVTDVDWTDAGIAENAFFEAQTDCEWSGSYLAN